MKQTYKRVILLFATIALIPLLAFGQTGTISTIAGNGTAGYSGDGGSATLAQFIAVYGIAIDRSGNILVSDNGSSSVVRKINTSGIITNFTGTGSGGFSGDGGPAGIAMIANPHGIWIDQAGNVYITDSLARIRKVNVNDTISTLIGTGIEGFSADGARADTALIRRPWNITSDTSGNIYFGDNLNYRIRKINTSGFIATVAGTGTSGYSGDGAPAIDAQIGNAAGVATDRRGNLYIADGTSRIRKIDALGTITTIAGTGVSGFSGDGGPAALATISSVFFVTTDRWGNVYFPDRLNYRIRKIDTLGIITTIAGNGTSGFSDGPCGQIGIVNGIAVDSNRIVYITDFTNYRVRKITPDHAPSFVNPVEGVLTVCADSGAAPIDAFLSVIDQDTGQGETWSMLTAPVHGSLSASYAMVATGGIITPSGLSYTPTPGYAGADAFQVVITDCGSSSDTTTIYVTVRACALAVNTTYNNAASKPTIYPDPATSYIQIDAANNIQSLIITNLLGRIVYTQEHNSGHVKIDIEDLSAGMYFININGFIVGKFVKQ